MDLSFNENPGYLWVPAIIEQELEVQISTLKTTLSKSSFLSRRKNRNSDSVGTVNDRDGDRNQAVERLFLKTRITLVRCIKCVSKRSLVYLVLVRLLQKRKRFLNCVANISSAEAKMLLLFSKNYIFLFQSWQIVYLSCLSFIQNKGQYYNYAENTRSSHFLLLLLFFKE